LSERPALPAAAEAAEPQAARDRGAADAPAEVDVGAVVDDLDGGDRAQRDGHLAGQGHHGLTALQVDDGVAVLDLQLHGEAQ
jgi:hypothetical protein